MSAVEVTLRANRRPFPDHAAVDCGTGDLHVRVLSVDLDETAEPEWVRVTGSFYREPAPIPGSWLVPWESLPERAQALLVDHLVAALQSLGCTTRASTQDVTKQVDLIWPVQAREQVLARMAAVEQDRTGESGNGRPAARRPR